MTEMGVYKHNCEKCKYLGTAIIHDEPMDIYFCEQELPYPSMIARYGSNNYQCSEVDIRTLIKGSFRENQIVEAMLFCYKEMFK
jgi:hypothetical protein